MMQQVPSKTPPQLASMPSDPVLPREATVVTAAELKQIRRHPTIAMARRLVLAPMLASGWAVEATDRAPEGAKDFVDHQVQRWRTTILRTAVRADVDYGWIAYEVVMTVTTDGMIGVGLVKPLLQTKSEILVDPATGDFYGVRQTDMAGREVVLQAADLLRLTFEQEGTYWYGTPRVEACRSAWKSWTNIDAVNDRYDRKVAGSSWVVYYPPGKSPYNGEDTDNYDIAVDLLNKLEASGAVVVPTTLRAAIDSIAANSPLAWKIELLSDGISPQYSFVARMKYLDALMVRGVGLPERAVLEGTFGTKAEAGEHADFAITDIETTHAGICEQVTLQLVDRLLLLNWGEEAVGTVAVVPSPILDTNKQRQEQLYRALLASPEVLAEEAFRIDRDALRDQLGIPFNAEADDGLTALVPGPSTEGGT